MKRLAILGACLALPASAAAATDNVSPSLQPDLTSPLDKTQFIWTVDINFSAGERSAPDEWLMLDKNALSGALSLRQPLGKLFYVSASGQVDVNPTFLGTENVKGAQASAELRAGSLISLGRSRLVDDTIDIFGAYQTRAAYEVSGRDEVFHDRVLLAGASFENVMSIICRTGEVEQCAKPNARGGWRVKASAGYSDVSSDSADRERDVITGGIEVGVPVRTWFPLIFSGSIEKAAYDHVISDGGGRRRDRTLSGYAGADLATLFPRAPAILKRLTLGARYTDINSNVSTKEGESYLIQLGMRFGERQTAF